MRYGKTEEPLPFSIARDVSERRQFLAHSLDHPLDHLRTQGLTALCLNCMDLISRYACGAFCFVTECSFHGPSQLILVLPFNLSHLYARLLMTLACKSFVTVRILHAILLYLTCSTSQWESLCKFSWCEPGLTHKTLSKQDVQSSVYLWQWVKIFDLEGDIW